MKCAHMTCHQCPDTSDKLRGALKALLEQLNGYEHHPEICSRTHECDEPDEDGCSYCGDSPCPPCECGLDKTQAAIENARRVLAEDWLLQSEPVSGTLAYGEKE